MADLAQLREQIAQALLDRFIARGMARLGGPTFPVGTKLSDLPASYRDDFLADAGAIRPALDAAWTAGRDAAAVEAERWLEDWGVELNATREGYIEAVGSGVHAGRRIAPETAKAFAREFRQRSEAVYDCGAQVAAAIRALTQAEAAEQEPAHDRQ